MDWQTEAEAPELGWCIGPRWWGMGLMPEAASAVLRFLFQNVGVLRVTARCDSENPKSARVMEKCGLRFVRYGEFQKLDGSCKMRSMEYEAKLFE